jgi:hypothetical protein
MLEVCRGGHYASGSPLFPITLFYDMRFMVLS